MDVSAAFGTHLDGNKPGHHKRRVRVGNGSARNQGSVDQQIACSGNVIPRLIPEIRQPQQGYVQQEDDNKNSGEY